MDRNVDLIGRGGGIGDVASKFASESALSVNKMRPWLNEKDGRVYISVFKGGDPNDPKSYYNQPIMANAGAHFAETNGRDSMKPIEVSRSRLGGTMTCFQRATMILETEWVQQFLNGMT